MTDFLHLSTFLHRPIFDSDGDRIGRVQDLVARLGDNPHPPVVGAVIRIEGRDLFVPIRKIGGLAEGRMTFEGKRVDLRRFERRPGELLLAEDLLARHLINLVRGRLSRPTTSRSPRLRASGKSWVSTPVGGRSCAEFLARASANGSSPRRSLTLPQSSLSSLTCLRLDCEFPIANWPNSTPLRSPTSSNRRATKRARRSSKPWALDRELEADVFEELDVEHQLEFLEARSDVDAARLLSRNGTRQRRGPHQRDRSGSSSADPRRARRGPTDQGSPTALLQRRHRWRTHEHRLRRVPATATAADALEAIRTSTRARRSRCTRSSCSTKAVSPLVRRRSRRSCAPEEPNWP